MKCLSVLIGFAALAGTCLGQVSGLVVLDPSAEGALLQTGTSTIRVPAHAIYVNSSNAKAVDLQGNVTLDTPEMRIVGSYSFAGGAKCTGQVICGGSPYTNPYANLAFPNGSNLPQRGTLSLSGGNTSVVMAQPGYYSRIEVSGNRNLILEPGVYVIGSGGITISAGTIYGNGVTIVMAEGAFNIAGSSSFKLYPPTMGQYAHMTILQPASNTNQITLTGNSNFEVQGNIYAPGAKVRMSGTSFSAVNGFPLMGDLVVSKQVEIVGTADLFIGRNNLQAVVLPKMPLFD